MTIGESNDPRIIAVEVIDNLITAHLADGRPISGPPGCLVPACDGIKY
jgi:hypothetical protein